MFFHVVSSHFHENNRQINRLKKRSFDEERTDKKERNKIKVIIQIYPMEKLINSFVSRKKST